jgi:hypothetical protein
MMILVMFLSEVTGAHGKFTKIGMSPAHRAMFAGVVGITMSSQKSSIAMSNLRKARASAHCRGVLSGKSATAAGEFKNPRIFVKLRCV